MLIIQITKISGSDSDRRLLSEPLIFVIFLIGMIGLHSKSRSERHGSSIGKFLRDFAPFAKYFAFFAVKKNLRKFWIASSLRSSQ
jgi:hypothetical protein